MRGKCIGCDTPIPYGATKCPMCGAAASTDNLQPLPMAQLQAVQAAEVHHHHHHSQLDKPVLIEQTGKKWKGMYLKSVLCFSIGMVLMMIGIGNQAPFIMMVAPLLFLAGIVLYIYARFGAWWNHG